jgi:nickel transport system substrate-binding protein
MRVESRLGEYDRFARNPFYWGAKPAYGEVLVNVIPDPNSRALALQAGELELIQGAAGEITAGTFVRLRDQGFATALSAPLATRTLAMNTGHGATRDLAVRQAINQAVNKQAIIPCRYPVRQQHALCRHRPETLRLRPCPSRSRT